MRGMEGRTSHPGKGLNMPARLRTTLRKDGRTAYTVLYRLDKTNRSFTFYDDPAAADELIALMNTPGITPEAALRAHPLIGGEVEPRQLKGPLLSEWVLECIDDNPRDAKPKSLAKYRTYVHNDMVPFFGADKRLSEVTSEDIADFMKHLKRKQNSARTIRNKIHPLSAALKVATKDRKISFNPMLDAPPRPKARKVRKTLLTEQEFIKIRDAFHQEGYRLLVEFLVMTGARWAEATAVKPADFDLSNGTVWIDRAWEYGEHDGPGTKNYYRIGPPKTEESSRLVDVPFELLQRLTTAGLLKPDREWVFTNSFGGPVRQYTFIGNVWDKTIARVDLGKDRQKVTIKNLRDAYISWHIADGTDPKTVQANVGHTNITTTMDIYARVDRRKSRSAADRHGNRIYGEGQ